MDPETIIENVQESAAVEAAETVAESVEQQVIAGDVAIATEVAAVSEQLAEHSEISEDRHDEILEETEWLSVAIAEIKAGQSSLSQMLTQLQTLLVEKSTEILLRLPNPPQESNPTSSLDSNQLTLPLSTEATEPQTFQNEEAENQAPKTVRKFRVI